MAIKRVWFSGRTRHGKDETGVRFSLPHRGKQANLGLRGESKVNAAARDGVADFQQKIRDRFSLPA